MKAFAGLLIKTTTQQTLQFITGFSAFKMLNLCSSHLYPRPQIEGIHVYWQKGIMTSLFRAPGISPALWGQAYGYNHALSPTLHRRKSHRGKGPIVKPLAIPWHCGDNQKVMALHLSLAILVGGGGGGGGDVGTNDWCITTQAKTPCKIQ